MGMWTGDLIQIIRIHTSNKDRGLIGRPITLSLSVYSTYPENFRVHLMSSSII